MNEINIPSKGSLIKAYDGVVIKQFRVIDILVSGSIVLRVERVADNEIMNIPIYEYLIAQ